MTVDLKQDIRAPRKALGRGLASLIPDAVDQIMYPSANVNTNFSGTKESPLFMCPVDKLVPSTQQPRQEFNNERIKELSQSIKENGIIEPIVVRRRGDIYEIVAGERRWRAAKLAGLTEVNVIVKDMSDKVALQTTIVENIQRADLNSMEEAKAYKQLIDGYSMTQEDVSEKVGKDRASVANYLRLLKLPLFVQEEIQKDNISMGHAKALCSLESEEALRKATAEILKKRLSVRKTERLVERMREEALGTDKKHATKKEHLFDSIEDNLRERFKTKIHVKGKYEKGSFIIEYYSKDDFERILGILFE